MNYIRNLARAVIGRPALGEKASAVGPLIARMMLGQAVWPKRDYEKLAREGYQQNPIVSRAVQLVAENAAQIPWVAYQGQGSKKREIDDHDIQALLANPNPGQDGTEFLIALYSHYWLSGNGYVERTHETKLGMAELYAHRPDRVRVVPGEDGMPMGYEYRVNGAIKRFDVDVDSGTRPILHMKTFHPTDDWYGMSPLDPAAWAIDIHNQAAAWNKALLDNTGAPSGAFIYKPEKGSPGTLTDDQYGRLKQQLTEQVTGARNAGKAMLLEGGLEWQQMGLDPEKMQHIEGKNLAAREIAFALGVPPLLLGLPGDNTYSNYQEANRAFYRQTVIPLAARTARTFTHWLAGALGKGVYLEPNIDDLDALAADRKEQWDRIEKAEFLTINEKREALHYEKVDGGDEVYVGAGQIPLGQDGGIAGGAAPADGADPLASDPAAGGQDAGTRWPRLVN